MDSEKGHKKRPYEPPKIYELEVDLTQAMGQTQCTMGRGASGACSRGNLPAGSGCADGPRVQGGVRGIPGHEPHGSPRVDEPRQGHGRPDHGHAGRRGEDRRRPAGLPLCAGAGRYTLG